MGNIPDDDKISLTQLYNCSVSTSQSIAIVECRNEQKARFGVLAYYG